MSLRSTIMSRKPCSIRNSAVWNSSGRCFLIVCSITRRPAKPMVTPGSAISTSPIEAQLAVTPPVVGSAMTLM